MNVEERVDKLEKRVDTIEEVLAHPDQLLVDGFKTVGWNACKWTTTAAKATGNWIKHQFSCCTTRARTA